MKTYLLLFTIGPVQSFISQARKAQDLYAGSRMLSDLVAGVIENLRKIVLPPETVELVFPGSSEVSYPNRFLAKLLLNNDLNAGGLGQKLEDDVRKSFSSLGAQALKALDFNTAPKEWQIQIESFLEIHWIIKEVEGVNYQKAYHAVEAELGAMKNYRSFKQLRETGRKCSLCGERNELVINRKVGSAQEESSEGIAAQPMPVIKNFAHSEQQKYLLVNGEGLCAVCFTKRVYRDATAFPSTAAIATADTVAQLEIDAEGKELLQLYKSVFGDSFDAQLFFRENLDARYFEKQGLSALIPKLPTAKEKLDALIKRAGELNYPFKKYFAIMMFDGDNMGKWLSGELLPEQSRNNLNEFHSKLTNALGKFALNTRINIDQKDCIVARKKGRVIYAGGEDFLGFLNLSGLFNTMHLLRQSFDTMVNRSLDNFRGKENITFSAGVVIAHYKLPLSEVLKMVRRQEKAAKENATSKKNAYSIAVMKHSGEINCITNHWGDAESNSWTICVLNEILEKISNGIFSTTFMKSLSVEFSRVADSNSIVPGFLIKPELERLLYRSLTMERGTDETRDGFQKRKEETVNDMLKNIMKIHEAAQGHLPTLLGTLDVIDFMSRKTQGEV